MLKIQLPTIVLLFGYFVILLVLGVPISMSLGISSIFTIWINEPINISYVAQLSFASIDKTAIMCIPFFVASGDLMGIGGLSRRLFSMADEFLGSAYGGLALATVATCVLFGAMSGSGPATVAAIGALCVPAMVDRGYDQKFSAAIVASAGAIGVLIPPSNPFVVYAISANVSVGKLFMAGLGAGVVYGLVSIVYIYFYAHKNKIPRDKKVGGKELLHYLIDAAWALMIPVIILGGIYGGFCTATEAAGISAIYAAFVGVVIYRELDWKGILNACSATARSCGEILVLVAAAQALGWMLTRGQVPQIVTSFIAANIHSKILFLLLVNVVLLVMGMFMEGVASIIIVAPLIYPAAVALGVDPIHLGTIMISNLAIGMFTPPFGMNIFVTSSITKADMVEMLPGIIRFCIVDLIALLLMTYIPQISMFLPNLLK